jgi:hypothetical protein
MWAWFRKRLSRAGIQSKRAPIPIGDMGRFVRSGPAAWILMQEKARLHYLAAKEEYERCKTRRTYKRLTDRLLQLQSTNAIITSLLNEHLLEQLIVHARKSSSKEKMADARGEA